MRRKTSSSGKPTIYRIVVRGELSRRYLPAFDGMALEPGHGETAIAGPVVDQAHLHGLLDRVSDLGLELISVNLISPPTALAVDKPASDQAGRYR